MAWALCIRAALASEYEYECEHEYEYEYEYEYAYEYEYEYEFGRRTWFGRRFSHLIDAAFCLAASIK